MAHANQTGSDTFSADAGRVFDLGEHRERREQRLRVASALCARDSLRLSLFGFLTEVATLTGSDRVAVVWIDEHEEDLVHAHLVVDLLHDRPRRGFQAIPLERAWDLGLPGTYEGGASANDPTSTLVVALGSDGARTWFLVADSVSWRAPLDEGAREQLLFLAGECSAVVLHRDLDALDLAGAAVQEESRERGFTGWAVLADLECREGDEEARSAIERRFLIGRLTRALVEDELVIGAERLFEQRRRLREELSGVAASPSVDDARVERILDALDRSDFDELAAGLIALGDAAEAVDHHHGALELYRIAYDMSAAVGAVGAAVDAARLSGRLHRRRARWSEAVRWYGVAADVSEACGALDGAAWAWAGLAVARSEMGNLPAAREGFHRALAWAERSGIPDVVGDMHHGLLSLEHAAGNLVEGLRHGWAAVGMFQDDVRRMRCLASVAGVLVDLGDLQAAEDAWWVVAHGSHEIYYRIYAWDALAYLAARRGDQGGFEACARRCDALGWESGPLSAKAEILRYRGLSYRALGRLGEARSWLERAVSFSETHGFNRTLFESEAALRDLEAEASPLKQETAAPLELREGLREMRRSLVGSGA